MNRPTTGVLRVLRSAVVTVVVVVLAVVAHVVGGGHVPSGAAAGAAVVAVALAVHVATRWRLNTAAVFALLTGGQLLLHRAFMASDAARSGPLGVGTLNAMPVGGLAHAHHPTIDPSTAVSSAASMASMHAASPAGVEVLPGALTPMLAAHVVATVLTTVVLAGLERVLWRIRAWLSPLFVALLVPFRVVAVDLPRTSRATFEHRPLHEVVLVRVLSRRGPPAGPVHA